MQQTVEQGSDMIPVPSRLVDGKGCPSPHIKGMDQYQKIYKESQENSEQFWKKEAQSLLQWDQSFTKVMGGSFEKGTATWFEDGSINASVNCVDRHAKATPDKIAIIYEGDKPGSGYKLSYLELQHRVCQAANGLKSLGVKKGDTVTIYLPNVPEALISVLACSRLGVIHSVVFAGFSSHALADRINLAKSKVLITADEGRRGGKPIHLKKIVDSGLKKCPDLKHVIVLKKMGTSVDFDENRDVWWHDVIDSQDTQCEPEKTQSEDGLFLLFTSGSTGSPKGLIHSTAGYLLGAAVTTKYIFDSHKDDVFFCTADIGWITGHTYLTYGPLMMGLTTIVFEGTPVYPTPSRFWDIVKEHKVTQFYTSPTALRSLRKLNDSLPNNTDLSSLRILGSVGEPIDQATWHWFFDRVGNRQCSLVDTYWQTETGSIILSPMPGATPMKPGCASVPMLGITPVLLDNKGKEFSGEGAGILAIKNPWPSMARTCFGDHQRYMDTYMNFFPGYYVTGDRAHRDKDGYFWIRGRIDDVINVSGHRLTTAELESKLLTHSSLAECAVIGVPDPITGQSLRAFITLKPNSNHHNPSDLQSALADVISTSVGKFAVPRQFLLVPDLPKTRSGKIMRRVLRKIVMKESDFGDLSSLSNPDVIGALIKSTKL